MKTQITITDKNGNKHVFDDIQDFKKKDVEVEPLYGRYNPGKGRAIYTADVLSDEIEVFKYRQRSIIKLALMLQNSHKTEKEAEQHFEWLTLNDKILSIIEEDPWRPDWNDSNQKKGFLFFNHAFGEVCKSQLCEIQTPGVQYMSKETADRILEEFSKDDLYFWITKEKRGV